MLRQYDFLYNELINACQQYKDEKRFMLFKKKHFSLANLILYYLRKTSDLLELSELRQSTILEIKVIAIKSLLLALLNHLTSENSQNFKHKIDLIFTKYYRNYNISLTDTINNSLVIDLILSIKNNLQQLLPCHFNPYIFITAYTSETCYDSLSFPKNLSQS